MKNKSEKRFHLLLNEDEFELLKTESEKRNISSSELIRRSIRSEIRKKTDMDRLLSLKKLCNLLNK
jgi:hypothetical protein